MLSATPTRRELLAWLLGALLIFTAIVAWIGSPAQAGGGNTPQTPVAFIATGANYPDALAASSPAAPALGPILLVQQDAIPAATLAELNRLVPTQIIIMGGTSAISQNVEDALDALNWPHTVTRISGTNRYETAAALSAATFPTSGKYPRVSHIGDNDVDDGIGGTTVDMFEAFIEAPYNGYLVIQADADFNRSLSDAIVSCWLWLDENTETIADSLRFSELSAANSEEDCATHSVIPVAAGNYSVGFRVSQDVYVNVLAGGLTVMWVPFGNFGQTVVIPEV